MKRKERLYKLVYDIYTQLFKEATPSVDYQWLLENKDEVNKDRKWYLKYSVPDGTIERVIKEQTVKNKIRLYSRELAAVRHEIYLGHSPREI